LHRDAAATASVPPSIVSASSVNRLWIDCVPLVSCMLGLAATEIVTSSAGPGSEGLLLQFPGVVQRLSPAAPVQLTAAKRTRRSRCSTT
jgi:hypothetical protein